MITVLFIYIALSVFLVTYLVIEEDFDVHGMEPALGRRIVLTILAPAAIVLIAVASFFDWMNGSDWRAPWDDLWDNIRDTWNGR